MMFPRLAGRSCPAAIILLPVLVALAAPLRLAGQSTSGPAGSVSAANLLAEAQAFMDAYAEDLRRGDRAALAARYDPAGVHELRPGRARRTTHEAIISRYATEWQPPATFEWRDLSYEVVGPDAVVVAGLFAWGHATDTAPSVQSYAALLRWQPEGGLRIRLEAEAGLAAIPWGLLGTAIAILAGIAMGAGWLAGRRRGRHQALAGTNRGAVA